MRRGRGQPRRAVIGGTGCRLNPWRGGRWGGCHGGGRVGLRAGCWWRGGRCATPGGPGAPGAAPALEPFVGGTERPPQASGPGGRSDRHRPLGPAPACCFRPQPGAAGQPFPARGSALPRHRGCPFWLGWRSPVWGAGCAPGWPCSSRDLRWRRGDSGRLENAVRRTSESGVSAMP